MNFLEYSWLIPLYPLLGAVLMLLFGRALERADRRGLISVLCPGLVAVSFIFSLGAALQLAQQPVRIFEKTLYTWVPGLPFHLANGQLARFEAAWGVLVDPLSAVMILVVSFVGFLIHVYSVGYMAQEGGYYRYFGYLNLFMFAMLLLVLANNYVLMFVGWEGVGLCSYLLIGFWFKKKSAADAGKKAFVMNRIGDAGFLMGMLLMLATVGSVRFLDVNQALASGRFHPEIGGFGVLSAMALLLFIGATGKSAQVPLYVWLPDAMEGPTPVSALIHAATMVTAGVYMVARSNALFALAPETSLIVAVVGAFTAILAASIALVQNDIKRVLAYSTVSQLGFMFMAAGVGAYWVAIFHLFTHAFFKALLFLGSGSVIHAMSGEQDMRGMGGLKDKMPVTFRTMFIGSVAIAGIPGLAGFFSKDEILWQVFSSPLGSKSVYVVGIVTATMTAFYMWRLMFMTFYGASRADARTQAHVHESPKTMTVPLVALAAGSALAGWIGVPKLWSAFPEGFRAFEHWLEPVFEASVARAAAHGAAHHDTSIEWLLMGLSVAVAVAGILVARYLYLIRPGLPDSIRKSSGPLYDTLLNKWYVDELYDFLFVNGLAKGGGTAMARFDSVVVDGGVDGAGWLTRFTSRVSIWWDTWIIDGGIRFASFLVKVSSYPVRVLQTGYLQSYALVFVVGVAGFLLYFGMR